MMTFLEKALGFNPKSMKLRTELIAGATTFLTMSYILAVNPDILSSTGMDKGALFTGTALAAAIATLLLAFMAKLPFAQAPSMGLNAFFAYTLCQTMGYSWQHSLAIMLIEGVVFIIITFFNVREMILNSIPTNLRYAISAGIGMFIAFIGLKNAGIIVAKEATFVGLGAFTPTCILGIVAILLSGVLMAKNVKGSLFLRHTNGSDSNPGQLVAGLYASGHQPGLLQIRLYRSVDAQDGTGCLFSAPDQHLRYHWDADGLS